MTPPAASKVSAAMADYRSNATVEDIAGRILAARRILLTTHVKPDGDGFGSALVLARALQERTDAKRVTDIHLMGPVEPRLTRIAGDTPYRLADHAQPAGEYDLVVVLDTGAWSQLEPIAKWLRDRRDIVIGIDHHAKGDDVASMRLVDSGAASTTAMLVPLLEAMGCPITGGPGSVAEAIFIGLATDTGWFRYSNAGPQALRLAADLLESGVDKSRLFDLIEETFRPQRLALQARALASLEYADDGVVAIMALRPQDFAETGGCVQDVSELVNLPMAVQVVRVSILLTQTAPGQTKLSFRSKPSEDDGPSNAEFDVNVLAQKFGGGGHIHASGAGVDMDVNEAKAALLKALKEI